MDQGQNPGEVSAKSMRMPISLRRRTIHEENHTIQVPWWPIIQQGIPNAPGQGGVKKGGCGKIILDFQGGWGGGGGATGLAQESVRIWVLSPQGGGGAGGRAGGGGGGRGEKGGIFAFWWD